MLSERRTRRLVLLACVSASPSLCSAASIHSNFIAGSGTWTDASVWSNAPGYAGDPNNDSSNTFSATVASGSVLLNSSISINEFTLGGTLAGNGTLAVASQTFADGAMLVGTGNLAISSVTAFTGGTVTNSGWTIHLAGDVTDFGQSTFINAGTLIHAGSDSSTVDGLTIINTGTIAVSAGTLNLFGGSSSGTMTIASGAALTLQPTGVFTISAGSVANAGSFINNGYLSISPAALAGSNLDLEAGELHVTGDFDTAAGQLQWKGGSLTGTGTTRLQSDVTFNNATGWGVGDGRTLSTNGHNITWNAGEFYPIGRSAFDNAGGGGTIDLTASSTFQIGVAASLPASPNSGNPFVANAGTIAMTAGGESVLYGPINNTGTITIADGGTLSMIGGGTIGGTVTATDGATLAASGVVGSDMVVSGTVRAGGMTLGDNRVATGTTRFTGIGTITGTTVLAAGTLSLQGVLNTGTFTVIDGAANFDGGTLTVANSINVGDGAAAPTLEIPAAAQLSSANIVVQPNATLLFDPGLHPLRPAIVNAGGTVNVTPGTTLTLPSITHPSDAFDANTSIDTATVNVTTINLAAGNASINNSTLTVNTLHAGSSSHLSFSNTVITNTSKAVIEDNGLIEGKTSFSGDLDFGGAVSPYIDAPGSLHVGGDFHFTNSGDSEFDVDIDGSLAKADQINVDGSAILNGIPLVLQIIDGTESQLPGENLLILSSKSLTGTFTGDIGKRFEAFNSSGSVGSFALTQDGGDLYLNDFQFDSTPEPAAAGIVLGVALFARRPKRKTMKSVDD